MPSLAVAKDFDVLEDFAAGLGACVIHYDGAFADVGKSSFIHTVPLIALVQIGCFVATGLYRRSYRYAGIADMLTTGKALGLAALASWLAVFAVARGRPESLSVTVLDAYLLATLVIGSRLSFRVLEYLFNGSRPETRRPFTAPGTAALRRCASFGRIPPWPPRQSVFLMTTPANGDRSLTGSR